MSLKQCASVSPQQKTLFPCLAAQTSGGKNFPLSDMSPAASFYTGRAHIRFSSKCALPNRLTSTAYALASTAP